MTLKRLNNSPFNAVKPNFVAIYNVSFTVSPRFILINGAAVKKNTQMATKFGWTALNDKLFNLFNLISLPPRRSLRGSCRISPQCR